MLIGLNAITKEMVLACRQLGLVVNEATAAYIASTIINPVTNAFFIEKSLEETDARIVVEESIKRLFMSNDPVVETLKLQAAYETKFNEMQSSKENTKSKRSELEERILDRIMHAKQEYEEDFESLLKLYKDVYRLLLLKCGTVTSSTLPKETYIEREITAALESVFPRTGLHAFMALTLPERKTQLEELAAILLGIRLYNRDSERPDEQDEHLPSLRVDSNHIADFLDRAQKAIDTKSNDCMAYYNFLSNYQHFETPPLERDIKKYKDDAIYHQQILSYLWTLQDDITSALERFQTHTNSYEEAKLKLETLIGGKNSVPKEQVYPGFSNLSGVYLDSLREMDTLNAKEAMFDVLMKNITTYTPALTDSEIAETHTILSRDLPEPLDSCRVDAFHGVAPVKLTADKTPKFLKLALDCQGYCVFTLVHRGILTAGNPMVGVLEYKNRHYVFKREDGVNLFMTNPDYFLQKLRDAVIQSPQLIHLLQLQADFPKQSLANLTQPKGVVQSDACVGTPLHFKESNIDKTYEWNCWTMRKTALQMADIRRMETRAAQTFLSTFRREFETQTYLPKEAATNTAVEKGTNPIRRKCYVTGLRDTRAPVRVVNIEFEQ
eukprot:GEMP01019230.1.p1 GENE.GEMP01019230.1~~GEMP01019230.1.p1  ORF type:complete len:622 (+),score=146.25 GEMP01019230.1:39-1868(+)